MKVSKMVKWVTSDVIKERKNRSGASEEGFDTTRMLR